MDDLEKNNKKNLPSKNNSETIKKPGCLTTTFVEKSTSGARVLALLRRMESPIVKGVCDADMEHKKTLEEQEKQKIKRMRETDS